LGDEAGAALLLRELPPRVDALSPENPLIFSWGPSVPPACLEAIGLSSIEVTLTQLYLFSISGGTFGSDFKSTGYDAIIVQEIERTESICSRRGKVSFKEASLPLGSRYSDDPRAYRSEIRDPELGVAPSDPPERTECFMPV
jgi:aldehyde:ferredoxin oxidoreductase